MMNDKRVVLLFSLVLGLGQLAFTQKIFWQAETGKAAIKSDAPLEIIKAESHEVKGIILPETKSFAFSIRMNSFQGFNSDIQQAHFLENYVEQKKYPNATFTGKFIEDIPFDTPGTYSVRAKGNLEIHGVVKERIIRGNLTIRKGSITVQSDFFIPVADHGITIPKIVMQKIAEQISVDINIDFTEKIKS